MNYIKISKESWHYQLMERMGVVNVCVRNDLCSYIRGLIISVSVPIIMILAPYILYLFYLVTPLDIPLLSVSFLVFLGLLVVMSIGLLIDGILILMLIGHYTNKYILTKIHRRETQYKQKKPNILIEYLKAKKQKICPLIEFID